MSIARTNDDLWFWMMSVLNGTKIYIEGDNQPALHYVGQSQNWSLTSINDQGEKLYDTQLKELLNHYPEIINMLQSEYDRLGEIDL